ncbi:hypothetical protein [Solitalea lacus]|uniref:hypothetical protein n=1 Tax=Solitalea lacus TaxID=2911172 RepID=UPI001ED9DEF9|nr:hypothetical protein [Solitalea lacus]UKJ07533.1 hypothetical protein L2B55_18700 [Solitalea lacus]
MKKYLLIIVLLLAFQKGFAQESLSIIQQSEGWFNQNSETFLKKMTPASCEKIEIVWDKAEQQYSEGKDYIKVPVNLVLLPTNKPVSKKKSKEEKAPEASNNLYLVKQNGSFKCVLVNIQPDPAKHLNVIKLYDGENGEFLIKQLDDILPLPKPNWYFEQPKN